MTNETNKYYIKNNRGTNAMMTVVSDHEYVILEGSETAHNMVISANNNIRDRIKILEDDDTIVNFKFTKNHSCKTPTSAANTVAGTEANGWFMWKNVVTNEPLNNIRIHNKENIKTIDNEIIDIETIDNEIIDNEEKGYVFSSESQFRDFLITNWKKTPFSKDYNIYEEDGEIIGKEFRTDDGGYIDILTQSKDGKKIVVFELKIHKTNDIVIGQIQRYMGYIKLKIAKPDQIVEGIIIVPEDNQRLQYAIAVTNNIKLYKFNMGDLNFDTLHNI